MTTTVEAGPELGFADGTDPVVGYLSEVLSAVRGLAAGTAGVADASRIDRISLLEKIKAAAAASQAEIVAFARSQVAAQQDAGVTYRRLGQGIAEQISLATRTSPWHGARRLGLARDLITELPQTFDLLARGEISEYVAGAAAGLPGGSAGRCEACQESPVGPAGQSAGGAGHHDLVRRSTAGGGRRPLLRRTHPPHRSTQSCRRRADSRSDHGRHRSRTADRAVTGRRAVGRAQPDDADGAPPRSREPDPGRHPGIWAHPGRAGDEILGRAGARVWWRRLFTAPTSGGRIVVGGDPTARRFTGWLAKLLKLRDAGICREPFCGAPIRHLDHITPRHDGGPTDFKNGRGVCERHNYVREMPGWIIELLADHPHTVLTVTPTGHTYLSRAPNPP